MGKLFCYMLVFIVVIMITLGLAFMNVGEGMGFYGFLLVAVAIPLGIKVRTKLMALRNVASSSDMDGAAVYGVMMGHTLASDEDSNSSGGDRDVGD